MHWVLMTLRTTALQGDSELQSHSDEAFSSYKNNNLLAAVTKINRVDGAPWLLPANKKLAGGSLAWIEALGSGRERGMGGGGGGGGGLLLCGAQRTP